MENIVVVGGGIAGVSCVRQLLEDPLLCSHDSPFRVIWISDSRVIKDATNVKTIGSTIEQFELSSNDIHDFARRYNGAVIVERARVSRVVDNWVYTQGLEGPNRIKFVKLCICTGAEPIVPRHLKVSDEISHRLLVLRDTSSVEQLAKLLTARSKVLIVGSGGIAMELVHMLPNSVVWVLRSECPGSVYFSEASFEFFSLAALSRPNLPTTESKLDSCSVPQFSGTFGPALGPKWFRQLFAGQSSGVQVGDVGNSVKSYAMRDALEIVPKSTLVGLTSAEKCSGRELKAELSNGRTVECDFVVLAIGAKPDVSWLKGSRVQVCDDEFDPLDNGVLVDGTMATSDPNVYAAGDVCCCRWPYSETWRHLRLWTVAKSMGVQAAKSILNDLQSTNGKARYLQEFAFELFSHVTEFFGFKVVLLGRYDLPGSLHADDVEVLVRCTPNKEFVQVVTSKSTGRVVGCTLIGDTGLEEVFENLILNATDIRAIKESLLDPNVDIEDFFD